MQLALVGGNIFTSRLACTRSLLAVLEGKNKYLIFITVNLTAACGLFGFLFPLYPTW